MAISAKEYLAMKERGEEPFSFPPKPKCATEGCEQTAGHPSDLGKVCEDCYFDRLGDLVESSPIGRNVVRC